MKQLRRRPLLAGLGATGTGILAGCAEDDGDDSSSGSLRLEQFRFLDDDPARYDTFSSVLASTYRPGDRLHLYLDPAGVSVSESDDGTETYDLTARVTVRDPNGGSLADGQNVTVRASDLAETLGNLYLLPTVQLSLQAVSGTYTAEVELVDEHAGESFRQTKEFEVTTLSPEALAIDHVRFVSEPATGHREYKPVQERIYEPGETVRLYVEPLGVEPVVRAARTLEYELDVSLLLLPPGEADIDATELTVSGSADDPDDLSELFFNVSYELPSDVPPGEYQLRMDLTDRNSGSDTSKTIAFQVD